jgi:hypothetical protein
MRDGIFSFFSDFFLAFSCFLIGLLVFPLCGGHSLFFAAAKKSKQKKAAHTANSYLLSVCRPRSGPQTDEPSRRNRQ